MNALAVRVVCTERKQPDNMVQRVAIDLVCRVPICVESSGTLYWPFGSSIAWIAISIGNVRRCIVKNKHSNTCI